MKHCGVWYLPCLEGKGKHVKMLFFSFYRAQQIGVIYILAENKLRNYKIRLSNNYFVPTPELKKAIKYWEFVLDYLILGIRYYSGYTSFGG